MLGRNFLVKGGGYGVPGSRRVSGALVGVNVAVQVGVVGGWVGSPKEHMSPKRDRARFMMSFCFFLFPFSKMGFTWVGIGTHACVA